MQKLAYRHCKLYVELQDVACNCSARYVDVMEQTLYNGLLSGISLDGIHYFYDNPLESDGSHPKEENGLNVHAVRRTLPD